MNVLVNEFAFVDVAIAEPDVDGVEPGDIAQNLEAQLFADFADRALAVTFAGPDVALRKSPLTVTIDDHRKVHGPALAFKHQPSSRDFGTMPFTLTATFA